MKVSKDNVYPYNGDYRPFVACARGTGKYAKRIRLSDIILLPFIKQPLLSIHRREPVWFPYSDEYDIIHNT